MTDQPCAICGIANKSHFTHGAPFGPDYHEYQAPDVAVTEAPVDGGFDGASVEAAETLWACLPHVRKWTSLATHEKALVIHTFARLSTQSAMEARIEKLEAVLQPFADDWNGTGEATQSDFERASAILSNIGGAGK